MKSLLYLIIILFLVNCKSDNENQSVDIDTGLSISIVNNEGIDLLNPNDSSSIKEKNIKLFYLINGEKEEFFDADLDSPKGFGIYKDVDSYKIDIMPYIGNSNQITTTFIELEKGVLDTIKCKIEKTENRVLCSKVWFNSELKWEAYKTERFFTVVK